MWMVGWMRRGGWGRRLLCWVSGCMDWKGMFDEGGGHVRDGVERVMGE